MVGSWNPTGKGFCSIPNEDFARHKLNEFWSNMRSSCVAAVMLQSAYNYLVMDHSLDQVIYQDFVVMSAALGVRVVLTYLLGYATKFLVVKPKEESGKEE